MSLRKELIFMVCLVLFANCSKESSDINNNDTIAVEENLDEEPNQADEPENDENSDDLPEPAVEPGQVSLIFPEHQTECNEGVFIDDEWSLVNFIWEASKDTDSYEVWIKSSENYAWQSMATDTTELEIQLLRGIQYQWHVVSINSGSTAKTVSETWEFYNSGTGSANFAPFTPTLIHPRNEQILRSSDSYYFQWTTSDLDNDPLTYDLFVGSHPDSLNLVKTLSETQESISNHVKREERSFWKIHASDSHGNTSKSEIYSFIRL